MNKTIIAFLLLASSAFAYDPIAEYDSCTGCPPYRDTVVTKYDDSTITERVLFTLIETGTRSNYGEDDLDSLAVRLEQYKDSLLVLANVSIDYKFRVLPWLAGTLVDNRHRAWAAYQPESTCNWTLQFIGGGSTMPWESGWNEWSGGDGSAASELLLSTGGMYTFAHEWGHSHGLLHTFAGQSGTDCDDSTHEISGGDSAWNAIAGDVCWDTKAMANEATNLNPGCNNETGWFGNTATSYLSSTAYWVASSGFRGSSLIAVQFTPDHYGIYLDTIKVYGKQIETGIYASWGLYETGTYDNPTDSVATGTVQLSDALNGGFGFAVDSIPVDSGVSYTLVIGPYEDPVRIYYSDSTTAEATSISTQASLPAVWQHNSYTNQKYMVSAHWVYMAPYQLRDSCGVDGDTCWANAPVNNYMSYTADQINASGEFSPQQINNIRCHLLFSPMKAWTKPW